MKALCWLLPALGCVALAGCSGATKATTKTETKTDDKERVEYITTVEKDVKDMDKRLEDWRAKAKTAKGDAKVKMDKAIKELEKKRDATREELKDLKGDTKGAWADIKKGMGKARDELKKSFDDAKEHFDD